MKTQTIDVKDLNNVMRLVELQREVAFRLSKFRDRQKQEVEELKQIKDVAQKIAQLKNSVRKEFITLDKRDRAYLNRLLKDRYLII